MTVLPTRLSCNSVTHEAVLKQCYPRDCPVTVLPTRLSCNSVILICHSPCSSHLEVMSPWSDIYILIMVSNHLVANHTAPTFTRLSKRYKEYEAKTASFPLSSPTINIVINLKKGYIGLLQWVQQNLGYFGGKEGSITIFGESAGSISLSYQMVSSYITVSHWLQCPDAGLSNG